MKSINYNKQIAEWKAEHKRPIFEVTFEDDSTAYFTKPNRNETAKIIHKAKGGPLVMAEVLVDNHYLGGTCTKEMLLSKEEADHITQLAVTMDDVLKTVKADVKKL